MLRKVAVLATLMVLSCAAFGQRAYVAIEQRLTPEQLEAVGLTPVQLQMLNAYLHASNTEVEADAREHAKAAEPDVARFAGLDTGRMTARAKGLITGWEPGTVFELDNGQQWKVLKGNLRLRTPVQDPAIVLVPGVAGRWFLQVDEDLPKARVYRID